MSLFLILLAAGDGNRLKSKTPKPYNNVNSKTILEYSLNTFGTFKEFKKIVIVFNKKHKKFLNKIKLKKNVLKIIGGRSRQESALKALKKIKKMNCEKVFIHDVARPNTSKNLIRKMIKILKKNHAVIPVLKPNDAIKITRNAHALRNLNKNDLRLVQTPQGFSYKKIYKKHIKNINNLFDDDSSLFVHDREKVTTVKGEKSNLKITTIDDLRTFESLKRTKTYYGLGFDIHKLIKGKKLYLGGIKISSLLGLKGHSDGDSVIHALIDSLLGACSLGDIGRLFSNKNKKYKNIRSTILLKKVIELIKSRNFSVNNIDINVIAEKPKMKKYRSKMIKLISTICEIKTGQINIKGKTTEKLGIIGKEKAIASEVITSVIKND